MTGWGKNIFFSLRFVYTRRAIMLAEALRVIVEAQTVTNHLIARVVPKKKLKGLILLA